MAAPSVAFPDLTNGQIAGIREERATRSVEQLAQRYGTTESTIEAVLVERGQAADNDGGQMTW